ncbi:hypothetical protein [Corynebacterium sp. UBA2622]|uniref:hypothetical protein n=1 Tax=Corynebacterium sp. UBA2622 TaxID=1946393 RepID=UPI0025BA5FAA|nr:hypothetical protein [Corynebacterium sp. UBA2622]
MDFTTTPPAPFKFGARFSDYPALEHSVRSIGDQVIESANGRVPIGEVERYVSLGETDGRIDYISINTLAPEDTFMGVSLSLRPIKFRNELKKLGISSTGAPWDFKLGDSSISFWTEEGEIVALKWESPSPSTH